MIRVPYSALYAAEFAKVNGSPENFIRMTNRMLMYLARYGHQDAAVLERTVPTVTCMQWVREIEEIVREENSKSGGNRR